MFFEEKSAIKKVKGLEISSKLHRKQRVGRLMRQIDEIEKLYKQGLSYADIGKQFGTKADSICTFIKKQGWTRPRAIHKNSPIIHADLIYELYTQDHQSISDIAKHFNCHFITILRILRKKGIKSTSDFLETEIKELYDKGFTYKEIGKHLKKAESTICHFIRSRGWTRPLIKKDRINYLTKSKIPENRKLVLRLYTRKKFSLSKISRSSNLSYPVVKKILIQEGVYNA